MRVTTLTLIATLLLGAITFLPTAAAHVCGTATGDGQSASGEVSEDGTASGRAGDSGDWESRCGPCPDGEDHAHGTAEGNSESRTGSAQGCVSSKRFSPGATVGVVISATLVALLMRR